MLFFKRLEEDRDSRIAVMLILFVLVLTGSLAILSEGTFGGADDLSHYKIARYAFRYPDLFFYHWGKPLFTIMAAPFAQFGFNGIRIFNVIISAVTLWFSYLIARRLNVSFSWSVIILTAFAPLYFVVSYTGMTEILFAFLVILTVWLFATDRYTAAVIIISFLPLVRNEGFVLWIPIAIALMARSRYRVLPFFATGFVIFSFLGFPLKGDLLWLIHDFPYRGAAEIYGSGSLFHFIKALPAAAGIPLLVLGVAGCIQVAEWLVNRDRHERGFFVLWFIVLPAVFYFGAHSFAWWRGMGNSAGLIRVLAAIFPLASLTAAIGLGYISGFLAGNKKLASTAVLLILLIVVIDGYTQYDHPTGIGEEERIVKEASKWIRTSGMDERKIYYYNPFLAYFMRVNPYDNSRVRERVPDNLFPSNGIIPGELVVWDSHFGPNEGGLNESVIAGSDLFRLIASFGDDMSLSESLPRVSIYERLGDNGKPAESSGDSSLIVISDLVVRDSLSVPFTEFVGWSSEKCVIKGGIEKYFIENSQEFSPSYKKYLSDFGDTPVLRADAAVTVITENNIGPDEILLVASLDRNGIPYRYLKKDLYEVRDETGYHGKLILTVPPGIKGDDQLSIYLWNRSKNPLYIDNLSLTLYLGGLKVDQPE